MICLLLYIQAQRTNIKSTIYTLKFTLGSSITVMLNLLTVYGKLPPQKST